MAGKVPEWLAEEVFYAKDHIESAIGDAMLEGTEVLNAIKNLLGKMWERALESCSTCPNCRTSNFHALLQCQNCRHNFTIKDLDNNLYNDTDK